MTGFATGIVQIFKCQKRSWGIKPAMGLWPREDDDVCGKGGKQIAVWFPINDLFFFPFFPENIFLFDLVVNTSESSLGFQFFFFFFLCSSPRSLLFSRHGLQGVPSGSSPITFPKERFLDPKGTRWYLKLQKSFRSNWRGRFYVFRNFILLARVYMDFVVGIIHLCQMVVCQLSYPTFPLPKRDESLARYPVVPSLSWILKIF